MPQILTPARLSALAGVATGLAAAATSLSGIFTVGSSIGNAVVSAAGVLGTVASVATFLRGQSAWEVTNANNDHELDVNEQVHQHNLELAAAYGAVVPEKTEPAEAHLSAGLTT